jgi:ubiquinone biosynthesis protein
VHDFLKHRQSDANPQLQTLINEQRRTNRLLQRLMWSGVGFVVGLVVMQLLVHIHPHF